MNPRPGRGNLPGLLLALGVTGGVLMGAPDPGFAQDEDRPEVMDVEFRGNRTFASDSLAVALEIRHTRCRSLVFQVIPLCPLGMEVGFDRHYLVPRTISRDSLRVWIYYYERGYEEVEVDTSMVRLGAEPPRVRVAFDIEEGRPRRIEQLTFNGVEEVEGREEVLRSLPVAEGDPLSSILLEATRDTLTARLRNRGYPNADILIQRERPADSYTARVDFDIYTGPRARFGTIVFDRDPETAILAERSLLRMLPFEEGDLYNKELVYQAQRNLFGLEIVRNASIEENLSFRPDSLVPLTVRVSEGDEHRVRTGVGWSSADCMNVESTWASRNFMGGARRLQIRGRVSNLLAQDLHDTVCFDSGQDEFGRVNWLASAELVQPWLFSTRNALTLSVFAERQSLVDVFVRRAVGVSASLTRSLGGGTSVTFSYRPQLSTLDAAEIFFCTSFLVCTPEDIAVLQGRNWLAPLTTTLQRNRTDDVLNPSEGYLALLDLEHASGLTGSDFAYNRVVAEGSVYRRMARRTVWAARVRAGWIAGGEFGDLSLGGGLDVLHPQKRFYAGGASSVRGFAQNRLGPRVLTAAVEDLVGYREDPSGAVLPPVCTPEQVMDAACAADELGDGNFLPRPQGGSRLLEATLEYRFRVGNELQAVLFTDAGQLWGEGGTPALDDLEFSPGLGIRYFSPVGPLRLDVGYRFRGAEPLQVVTSGVRPFDPATDDPDRRIMRPGPTLEDEPIEWVELAELSVLEPRVRYGGSSSFLGSLQLHFSIGQAF